MEKPKFNFREISPLFFAILIDILGFGLVYPVLTAMFTGEPSILPKGTPENLRFFYLAIGFMLYPFFMFFGSSFMGDLSDKLGRKTVILICMIGLTVGFGMMGLGVLTASLFLLFFGRGLSGLMGASMPVVLATISDLSPDGDKAIHMSYVALIQSVGFVLGPLLGGILSDPNIVWFFNYSIPFFVSAGLALSAFIWIYFSFVETFKRRFEGKIDFLRLFKNFYKAAQHKKIRLLSMAFLFMQIAISLYLQLILIYYRQNFGYQSAEMGLFNAYIGFWFGMGLLLVVPYVTRRYRIEKIALSFLFIAGITQVFISFTPSQVLLWILGIPLAVAVQVGFTSMLTSFSNGAEKNEQGWAMGITGAVIALSFAITGLSPNLVPELGVMPLIFIGAILMLFGALLMLFYCKRFLKKEQKG